MSVLFCDTNCELWYTRAEELGLKVIQMPYILDGEEVAYDLGKQTDFRHFYDKVRAGVLPTTAALNEFDYTEYFEPVFASGQDIYYITFSHQLSGTFAYMNSAIEKLKEKYPERKITIYNTRNISMGAGIIVYYAAKYWKEGATDEELTAFLDEIVPKAHCSFCVDSLAHLHRGGRISKTAEVFGTMLGIKPLITVQDDGTLKNVAKVKGARKVVSELANLVKENADLSGKYEVFAMHADCEEESDRLVERVKEIVGDHVTVTKQIIGPVIATHCGPGTLGIVFIRK